MAACDFEFFDAGFAVRRSTASVRSMWLFCMERGDGEMSPESGAHRVDVAGIQRSQSIIVKIEIKDFAQN